jgi:hypothetical protein
MVSWNAQLAIWMMHRRIIIQGNVQTVILLKGDGRIHLSAMRALPTADPVMNRQLLQTILVVNALNATLQQDGQVEDYSIIPRLIVFPAIRMMLQSIIFRGNVLPATTPLQDGQILPSTTLD